VRSTDYQSVHAGTATSLRALPALRSRGIEVEIDGSVHRVLILVPTDVAISRVEAMPGLGQTRHGTARHPTCTLRPPSRRRELPHCGPSFRTPVLSTSASSRPARPSCCAGSLRPDPQPRCRGHPCRCRRHRPPPPWRSTLPSIVSTVVVALRHLLVAMRGVRGVAHQEHTDFSSERCAMARPAVDRYRYSRCHKARH